jgi:hypothetical protein
MKFKSFVLPFNYKQYKRYATLLHVFVNNAVMLVVDILNV